MHPPFIPTDFPSHERTAHRNCLVSIGMFERNGTREARKYGALKIWTGQHLFEPFAAPAGIPLIFLGNIDFYCAFL